MLQQFGEENCTFKLISQDPLELFKDWFDTAANTKEVLRHNACALSTSSSDGRPSSRMVSLGGFDHDGFKWNTNYNSRKGQDMNDNPQASMLFFWNSAIQKEGQTTGYTRQVIIEGAVKKKSEAECSSDFKSWPKALQVTFAACVQGTVIPNREVLATKRKELESILDANKELQPIDGWGGYTLQPRRYEFWQQWQGAVICDRIIFRKENPGEQLEPELTHKTDKGWLIERLAP